MEKKRYTTFEKAVNMAFGGKMVLCNKLPEIDTSIWDNMRESIEDEYGNLVEVFQWFILGVSDFDIEYFEKTFNGGAVFSYSDLLDNWVMGVTHYGTPWSGVEVEVIREDFPEECLA